MSLLLSDGRIMDVTGAILRLYSVESREMEPGQEEKGLLNIVREAILPVETSNNIHDIAEEVIEEFDEEEAVPVAGAAAAGAVAPEGAAKRARKPREIKPTDSKSFFRARAKDIGRFKFTSDGNLLVPPIGGEESKILPLPYYSESTPEERKEIDTKRRDDILAVEREYDELSRQLYVAMEEWKSSGDYVDAVRLQKELLALDSRRTSLRSPIRWGNKFKNPTIKTVLMHETAVVDEKNQDLKLGYDVMCLVGRPYTFEQEVRVRDKKPEAEAKLEDAKVDEVEEESFVIFGPPQDPEYGILSPETPVEFVYNTTKYTSILQAYYVERATQVGRIDMRATLLKLVNPKTIRSIGSRVVGKEKKEIDMPLELLTDIVKSLVLQDARFAPLLRKTGVDTLVYAEPLDKILGVGLSGEEAANPSQWNGAKNLLGQAWQAVRKGLPAEEEAVQSGGVVLESGRTVQDVKSVRANILKGYYRRRA